MRTKPDFRNVRDLLLEYVEDGLIDVEDLSMCCLKWMSIPDLMAMAIANDLFLVYDDEDEEDEDESDTWSPVDV